jgi:dsDNA-binding SOS-regulon protein
MVKWDAKIIKTLYRQSKNETLSESERELYFWLAQNRNNLIRIILRSGKKVFYFNDPKTTDIKGQKVIFKYSKHSYHWVAT